MSYSEGQRAAMAWRLEQRAKKIRRYYYHALDIAGALCWSMLFVLGVACVLFLCFHK